MTAAALIEAISGRQPDRLLVARALDPALRNDLSANLGYEELPFVRGRTVIPGDIGPQDLVVAGHPNYFGIFDRPGSAPWIAVTGRWSALSPVSLARDEVAMEPSIERDVAAHSLDAIRALAKHLTHVRGVTVVFPAASPILIVLLAVDPVAVVGEMHLPACTPLETYTELPGGLRIEAPTGASHSTLEGYAGALEQAVAVTQVETSHRWK